MSFRRRMMMAANSKPYDAEVEYLESDGAQSILFPNYIPTGYDNIFETKITYLGYTNNNNQWIGWFSAYTNEQSDTYRIIRYADYISLVYVNNGAKAGGGGVTASVSIGTTYDIKLYPTYALFNNTRINLSTARGNQNTSYLKLFANGSILRFYNFKWAKGDNIMLDLIPVRVGQVGYMYDKVSGQLFGNSGTGNFILGNDVN